MVKDANEKAVEWLNENLGHMATVRMRITLTNLLKEQDKETRKACAEEIKRTPGDMFAGKKHLLTFNKAIAACMNTKAV